MSKRLSTASDVMDALGGTAATAKLTGRKYNAACNWRAFDKFPANTYIVMTRALAERGLTAPASLWSMVDAAASERASA